MLTITIKLPGSHRLSLKVAPQLKAERLFSGLKVTRVLRKMCEGRGLKKLLGTNLAMALIATNFIPNQTAVFEPQTFTEEVIAQTEVNLPTDKATRYPVEAVIITQGYKFYHPGLDLDGVTGDSIYPIMKGVVVAVDNSKYAYGKAILIDHGNGVTSLYAHLSHLEVEPEQFVSTNVEIGQMGATGNAHGDHLHLEIRKNGLPVNPLSVLPSSLEK